MSKINYSVIIPHKNCIDLLKRCIDSIPQRDDLEIIVIDDNSGIPASNFPYLENERISYIFLDANESNYAGHARNVGLTKASGKWLLFADADDYYSNSLNTMLDKYRYDNIHDIVYLSANMINEKGEKSEFKINRYIRNYLSNKYYSEKILRFGVWTPWTRMVKRELVIKHNLLFEETPTGNDLYFGIATSGYSSKIACETDIIYNYYRPTSESLTDSYYTIKNLESRIRQTIRLNHLYDIFDYKYKFSLILSYQIPHSIRDQKAIKEYKEIRKNVFITSNQSIVRDVYRALKFKLALLFKHI